MKRLRLVGAMMLIAACGSSNPSKSDAPIDTKMIDAKVFLDGSGGSTCPEGPFTCFVIDLVLNHQAVSTPVAFASFATLADPDANNIHAYDSLF
jgi:hypothetical protein